MLHLHLPECPVLVVVDQPSQVGYRVQTINLQDEYKSCLLSLLVVTAGVSSCVGGGPVMSPVMEKEMELSARGSTEKYWSE